MADEETETPAPVPVDEDALHERLLLLLDEAQRVMGDLGAAAKIDLGYERRKLQDVASGLGDVFRVAKRAGPRSSD